VKGKKATFIDGHGAAEGEKHEGGCELRECKTPPPLREEEEEESNYVLPSGTSPLAHIESRTGQRSRSNFQLRLPR
jgi:hypothetical protein